MKSIIRLFGESEVRFVNHPENKYEFGIIGYDFAKILESTQDGSQISRSVDESWKGLLNVETDNGTQNMTVIWEPGIYQLLAKSRKPKAKPFQKWLFEEVLPSIRKTGSYEKLPQSFGEALALAGQIQLEKEKLEKEQKLLKAELKIVEETNVKLAEIADELFQYSSIIRVAKFNDVSEKSFRWQRLKAGSEELGHEIKKAPCPRYGTKNLYHNEVWLYCYPDVDLPEATLDTTNRNLPVVI